MRLAHILLIGVRFLRRNHCRKRKFSRGRRPFRSHHVQVRTYGMTLSSMGFDTSQLFYAIIIAKPEARHDKTLNEKVIKTVAENGSKEAEISVDNARIYLTRFDNIQAEREIEWAMSFWSKEREAIPTRNPNKCKSCEYGRECNQSLIHSA